MKKVRRRIRKEAKEPKRKDVLAPHHIDGAPWSGTPEDLAQAQSKTWGGGEIVDPTGYKKLVDAGIAFTQGKAKSPLQRTKKKVNETSGNKMKINRKILKRLLEEIEAEMVQTEVPLKRAPIEHEEPQEIPGVETKEDAWAGGDNLSDPTDWEAVSGISNQTEQEVMKITESSLRKMIRATILKGMNK